MKKTFLIILLAVILLSGLSAQDFLETPKKGFINFRANLLFPTDENYKATYGDNVILPEIKAGYFLSNNFAIWGSIGLISKEGTTPQLGLDAKSSQTLISFGIAYNAEISKQFNACAFAGMSLISYTEEAMDIEISESASGFNIGLDLIYNLNKSLFINAGLNYINGKDTVQDVNVKLGGFLAGIGAGLRF